MVKLVQSINGYSLDQWIKHEIETDIDERIITLSENLEMLDKQTKKVKAELESILKVKEAMEISINYINSKGK